MPTWLNTHEEYIMGRNRTIMLVILVVIKPLISLIGRPPSPAIAPRLGLNAPHHHRDLERLHGAEAAEGAQQHVREAQGADPRMCQG